MSIEHTLMDFRTTWLRAVAHAWLNVDNFAQKLVDEPEATLGTFQGFKWKWQNLKLVVDPKPDFVWIGDEWTWPVGSEDQLIVKLPLRPRIAPEKHAIALADYYRVNSFFLMDKPRPQVHEVDGGGSSAGALRLSTSAPLRCTPALAKALNHRIIQGVGYAVSGEQLPPGGFIPPETEFLSFEVALNLLMAKCWENTDFVKVVTDDTKTAVATSRGFTVPWALIISIQDDPYAKWDETSSSWSTTTQHELRLCLPARPKTPRDQALALSAYNATGAEYPFTCCA